MRHKFIELDCTVYVYFDKQYQFYVNNLNLNCNWNIYFTVYIEKLKLPIKMLTHQWFFGSILDFCFLRIPLHKIIFKFTLWCYSIFDNNICYACLSTMRNVNEFSRCYTIYNKKKKNRSFECLPSHFRSIQIHSNKIFQKSKKKKKNEKKKTKIK